MHKAKPAAFWTEFWSPWSDDHSNTEERPTGSSSGTTNDNPTIPSQSSNLDVLANCSDIDAKFVIGDIKAVIALMSFILTASGMKFLTFWFYVLL